MEKIVRLGYFRFEKKLGWVRLGLEKKLSLVRLGSEKKVRFG